MALARRQTSVAEARAVSMPVRGFTLLELMVVLVIEGASDLLTGDLLISRFIQSIGFSSISDFYTIFIQGYFFTIVLAELLRGGRVLPRM